jgi:hypothetical protein
MTFAIPVQKLPLPQVAAITGLPEPIVRHLVDAGVLAGGAGVADLEDAQLLAGQLAEARAGVDGRGILATDAAEKYKFDVNTIYKWQKDGWVKVLVNRARNRIVNEGDIAYARALANMVGQVKGKAIFPPKPRSGRPRKRKSNDN